MSTLRPVHHSARGKRLTPNKMTRANIDKEQCDALMGVALSIFTDCCNVGTPFQDALLAVYLSGLQHGHALSHEVRS